eukprot:gene21932-27218_t
MFSERDFYFALKLIALAQEDGGTVSREHLSRTGCAVPTFNGPAPAPAPALAPAPAPAPEAANPFGADLEAANPFATAAATESPMSHPMKAEQKQAEKARLAAQLQAVQQQADDAAAETERREHASKLAALEAAIGPPDFA